MLSSVLPTFSMPRRRRKGSFHTHVFQSVMRLICRISQRPTKKMGVLLSGIDDEDTVGRSARMDASLLTHTRPQTHMVPIFRCNVGRYEYTDRTSLVVSPQSHWAAP